MTTPSIQEVVERLRKALEAGPTPGDWMFQGTAPFTMPDDAFAQWGEFRISANSLDLKDDDYYRIGSISNRNGASQNEANAAFVCAANPTAILALLTAHEEAMYVIAALRQSLKGIAEVTLGGWHEDDGTHVANSFIREARAALAANKEQP